MARPGTTSPEAAPPGRPAIADGAEAAPRPGLRAVWFQAVRPFSFTASIVPVLVGGACAAVVGDVSPLAFLLCLAGGVALQAGTNLVNDYYDWRLGADHTGSLGPSRVIQEGWLSPSTVLLAGIGCFAAGGLAGLALVALAGWPILLLGLIGIPLTYGYTAPPLKLAYRGLGEVNVFFLMGPLMVVGGFLVHRAVGLRIALAASLPVGLLVAAILHANNVRDREDDRRLGKRTLATIVGPRWAKREFDLLVGGAFVTLVGGVLLRLLPRAALLALLSLPLALEARRTVAEGQTPRELAPSVRQTAALHLRFGALLAVGLTVAAAWRRLGAR